MTLELFNKLMEFVLSDILYTLLFASILFGFFIGLLLAAKPQSKKSMPTLYTILMIWGGISALIVLFVLGLLTIDFINVLAP